ncbi:hypothetical protein AMAG_18286 [Allomyces macrogynus ATCC 38327]|uniref:Uncharacterized protein n=1 Tax=Allomyces macrogynus (strain ATCC 38327) TaxID=578462 RepID=A0A0L0S8A0_ALLM3|nr:hypothetical protein AMAG_18286 [Allomyces macrogynus ATCC 38327]|eukprot:KNE58635.1 hypothetical protein AMAG_18286 [Allomyces macrogynus ATCC 38327]
MRGDLDKPASASGIIKLGRMRFNANCSDPKDPFTDCKDKFTVPSGWRNGEMYACSWFWNFDGNQAGEEYSTCFDIKVAATAASSASVGGAIGFESGVSGKPAPVPVPVPAPVPAPIPVPVPVPVPAAPAAPAVPATPVPAVPAPPASPAKPATPSPTPASSTPSTTPPAKKSSTSSPPSKFAPRPKATESVPVPAPQSVVITPPQPLPKITVSLPAALPSVPAQAKNSPAVQLPVPGKGARAMQEAVAKVMSRIMATHKKRAEARMGVPFRAARVSETEVTK